MNFTAPNNLNTMKYILFLTCSILLSIPTSFGQSPNSDPDPLRFDNEIEEFKKLTFDESKDRIVFTGSSSVRMWKDVQSYYPNHQIINTGFGGSHMSDLLYYINETVLRFSPTKVFIYEGDNDVAGNITNKRILKYTNQVIAKIQERFPNCQIILISPKPSVLRWELKSNYEKLNRKLEKLASKEDNISFANVWDIMLDENGVVRTDIFLEDNLHMNKTGYDLWDEVISKYLD